MNRGPGFKIISILSGITLALALLFLAELAARTRAPLPFRREPIRLSGEPPAGNQGRQIPTHLKTTLPAPIASPLPFPDWGELYYLKMYEPSPFRPDPELGQVAIPGLTFQTMEIHGRTGKLAYRVHNSIDEEGRRKTVGPAGTERNPPLLLLGCSYAYGEGLEDQDTLASQLAKRAPSFRVLNYGMAGWGPGNTLRLVQDSRFGRDIQNRDGAKVIYLFIDHHVNRMVGSLDLYRSGFDWASTLPFYFLDSAGELRTSGMISSGSPIRYMLFSSLGKSALLARANVQIPRSFNSEHFRLFSKILAETRDTLQRKFGKVDFTVAFYPASLGAAHLIPLLDELGIPSLDYSQVNPTQYVRGPVETDDGHPSKEMNEFLARQIATDLGL